MLQRQARLSCPDTAFTAPYAPFLPPKDVPAPVTSYTRSMKIPTIFLLMALAFSCYCGVAPAALRPDPTPPVSSLAGQLLVAGPRMADPNFTRCVIFMVAHTEEGALGLVVNRVYGAITLRALFGDLGVTADGDRKVELHYGGPVQFNLGFVLHSADYEGVTTQLFRNRIGLSTGPDVVQAVAAGRGPKRFLFLAGYTGWGAGQLEREMARGDWLVAPADPELIFAPDPGMVWEKAMVRAGYAM